MILCDILKACKQRVAIFRFTSDIYLIFKLPISITILDLNCYILLIYIIDSHTVLKDEHYAHKRHLIWSLRRFSLAS